MGAVGLDVLGTIEVLMYISCMSGPADGVSNGKEPDPRTPGTRYPDNLDG